MTASVAISYGEYFKLLLIEGATSLLASEFERSRNAGAPASFGENHLREYLRSEMSRGTVRLPTDWPYLVVERAVSGNRQDGDCRHGAVDYLLTESPRPGTYSLTGILATCEVAGPARKAFLNGSRVNWHPKILADLRKQQWRAIHAPQGSHYVAVLLKAERAAQREQVRDDFSSILQEMLHEVGARATELVMDGLDQEDLYVAVFRVLPNA